MESQNSARRKKIVQNSAGEGVTTMLHLPDHEVIGNVFMIQQSTGDDDVTDGELVHDKRIKSDRTSIILLTFLYVLQGIPLGISSSIPYLLQSRKVSYKDQAVFSFVTWPFSIKLLWAPIVDSVYYSRFGRRKSWLIPTQYLIGLFMLVLSQHASSLIGRGVVEMDKDEESVDSPATGASIYVLTAMFFMLNFLAATQDIAVDGWALTMLSKQNVGLVSTCNTVGQTAGFFLGNVVFLALESADFCNRYLRTEPQSEGFVTLGGFLYFWGIMFFISTSLVMVLKHESSLTKEELEELGSHGVVSTYHQLIRIVKLPSVFSLISILLTVKIGFAAADAVTGLKLIEEGVPKENLALMAVPMVPIDIILPVVISKHTKGPRPLDVFVKAMPYRLLLGLGYAVLVWWTPSTKAADGSYPSYFYVILLCSLALHQVAVYCMFVAIMAFFARISDPAIGGTYMTLLNTLCNLGGNWPATVVLWLVDSLTIKGCKTVDGLCTRDTQVCTQPLHWCTIIDGYYIESLVCFVIGILWVKTMFHKVNNLQDLPLENWKCR